MITKNGQRTNVSFNVKKYLTVHGPVVPGTSVLISVLSEDGEPLLRRTSVVTNYWPKTGEFRTLNTHYIPSKK